MNETDQTAHDVVLFAKIYEALQTKEPARDGARVDTSTILITLA